ncbi:MAG: endonuclease [Flavobacterium sp.]|nr:endonuclease [Candidatus Neoflavobacterium equi]
MKKITLLLALFATSVIFAQQQAYYNGIDFNLNGQALKQALSTKITSTHTRSLSYGDLWNLYAQTDKAENNSSHVVLIYGWENGTDADVTNDRTRLATNHGGNNGQFNREHVFAQSLGTPALGESGAGSDGHHLRPADVQRNSSRGNLKFTTGTGNSRANNGGWYPGDEWKGDVARIIMYTYLRYPTQCLPTNVGIGSSSGTGDAMIDLFLRWNAEDPVSALEIQRNDYLANRSNTYGQGNRNPFIDNPYLATKIWGGQEAEDRWGTLGTTSQYVAYSVYPNPTDTGEVNIVSQNAVDQIQVIDIKGQVLKNYTFDGETEIKINIKEFTPGVYFLKIIGNQGVTTRKVILN